MPHLSIYISVMSTRSPRRVAVMGGGVSGVTSAYQLPSRGAMVGLLTEGALASGASGQRIKPESDDALRLGEALDALLRQLALEIVRDGEGAKRVGRIVVRGRPDSVEPVAREIANSPLVKAALHGGDPNFGRILQAAGQVWPAGEPFVADLEIEGHQVVSAGDVIEPAPAELVSGREIEYVLTMPGEGGQTEVFFSDLSPEYVNYNADYTS